MNEKAALLRAFQIAWDKMFKVDGLDTFKPQILYWKIEFEFKTPTELIIRNFNPEG